MADRQDLETCEKVLQLLHRHYNEAMARAQDSKFPSWEHVVYMRDAAHYAAEIYSLTCRRDRLMRELFCEARYGTRVGV